METIILVIIISTAMPSVKQGTTLDHVFQSVFNWNGDADREYLEVVIQILACPRSRGTEGSPSRWPCI